MVKYIIQRPIAVLMIVLAVLVLSVLAAVRLPISLLPDVDVPQVKVQVDMPGAAASQVEDKAIRLLRGRLSQLPSLKAIRSESKMDAGTICLDFAPGSKMDLITIEVNEKVDMAMVSLPKDVQRPKVMKTSVADIPAFFVDLTLKGKTTDMQRFSDMSSLAVNVVRKRLEQIPQISIVDVSGTLGQQIWIVPHSETLQSLGLTTLDIEKALVDNNIRIEALSIVDGLYRYNIHFDSQLLTVADMADIPVYHNGRMLRLSDLCDVRLQSGVHNGLVRHDGKPAVTMAVVKQSEARMSDLRAQVDSTLADLRHTYPSLDFSVTRDQTALLSYSLTNLESNLFVGCLFTCLVLLFFLRSWRLSLIVSLTIPLSLLLTLFAFRLLGITLNVISISGLILGVGMIVDNAIIVIDNIMQKWKRGLRLADAVCLATEEVFTPMLSSVLTTCSVFVPLMFLSGLAGELFYDMSVGISVSLLVSLLVAMTVVPVSFHLIYKQKNTYCWNGKNGADVRMHDWYERTLCWVLRHQRLSLGFFVFSLLGFVVLYQLIDKQRMPRLSHDDMQMMVSWNEGISEEESDRRINLMLAQVGKGVETTTSLTGAQGFVLSHSHQLTGGEAMGYVKCRQSDMLDSVQKRLREYCRTTYPLATIRFETVGNPFDLILNTNEYDLVLKVKGRNEQRPTIKQVEQVQAYLHYNFPQLYVPQVQLDNNLQCRADVNQMAYYGVSYSSLLSRLRQLTGTNKLMELSNGEQSVPVVVGTMHADWTSVMQSTVRNAQGVDVPLSYLLSDSVVKDYKSLYASEMSEYYPINLNLSGEMVRRVMQCTDSLQKADTSLNMEYSGGYFSSRELVSELMMVFAVSLILLFLILAAQFESLVQPLIILSEMAINGFVVLMVLYLLDESLNLMSMIGLVVMGGIVINDSILKIDTINRKRRTGMGLLRAVVEAGSERLRPIVMTSATTIFAMLPFLTRGSMGSDLQYPLSLTIIVGMVVGTLVSLFFIPLLYYITYKRKAR